MRYTAVFEFQDGYEPAVGKKDRWLGGEIVALQFSDALAELEALRENGERYSRDVGGAFLQHQSTVDKLRMEIAARDALLREALDGGLDTRELNMRGSDLVDRIEAALTPNK